MILNIKKIIIGKPNTNRVFNLKSPTRLLQSSTKRLVFHRIFFRIGID